MIILIRKIKPELIILYLIYRNWAHWIFNKDDSTKKAMNRTKTENLHTKQQNTKDLKRIFQYEFIDQP